MLTAFCRAQQLPGSVVGHHGVAGRAGDAVVVLEKPQVAPRRGQVTEEFPLRETVGWMIVSTGTPHLSQRQAEDDFRGPVEDGTLRFKRLRRTETGGEGGWGTSAWTPELCPGVCRTAWR